MHFECVFHWEHYCIPPGAGLLIPSQNSIDAAALPILVSYLTALDRVEEARVEIAKIGVLIKDRFGIIKANPYCAVERDNTLIMHRAFRLLGFDQEPRGGNDQGNLFG